MKSKLILNIASVLLLGFVMSNSLMAQEGFQRFYSNTDRTIINMGNSPTDDGGFYMLNLAIENVNQTVDRIQLSRNNPKGNLMWTTEYTLLNEVLVTNLKSVDFVQLDNDTLIINGITQIPGQGLEDEKFIIKVEPTNGDIIWSGLESDLVDNVSPVTIPVVLDGYDNSAVSYNTHGNAIGDTFAIQRIKYNSNNEVINQQGYYPVNIGDPIVLSALLDAVNTIDSNEVISFVPDNNSVSSALVTIDTAGDVLSSLRYSISPDSLTNYLMQATAITATIDTGVVLSGVIVNQLTGGLSNFLIKTDSIGIISWSKLIDGNISGIISQLNDVVERDNGEIVVSGKYFNTTTLLVGDFMIYFDSDGNVIRQLDYLSDYSFFFLNSPQGLVQFTQGELGNAPDGGLFYSTSGFDQNQGLISPYIIKTDILGDAMCNDTFDFDMVTDFEFVRDTLIIETGDFARTDTLALTSSDYQGYSVPILTLADTTFCPNDPIIFTIDATFDGATSYIWSTQDTTPSIEVFEEGEYSVTVTVGDRICYIQCDTSNVSISELPEASITPDFSGVCELGEINLSAGASNSIDSLIWSTSETESSITITTPGTYSLTITDNCGDTAAASIEIIDEFDRSIATSIIAGDISCANGSTQQQLQVLSESNFETESILWSTGETTDIIEGIESMDYSVTVTNICGVTSVSNISISDLDPDLDFSIDPGFSNVMCDGATVSLILMANVNSAQSFEITWSDGTIGNLLEVSEPGTYTATVINECGDELSGSIDVTQDDLETSPPMPTITMFADTCDFVLTAMPGIQTNVLNFDPTFIWSTGEDTNAISVTTSGLFTVTVTDGCGNTGSAEIEIENNPDLLVFPNIFFPESNTPINTRFGPINRCPVIVDNYVLEVFNRFGNKVFESNNLGTTWNGNFSGSRAPRDVYMYQFSYDFPGGETQEGSGTITLMR